MKLTLSDQLGEISYDFHEGNSKKMIVIAHGAGAGKDHIFIQSLANQFAKNGISAIRFNFPYMEQGKSAPGSPKKNITAWLDVINHLKGKFPDYTIILSGKSYGGRMASHLLESHYFEQVKGIIYFGFPLHAPGKDSTERASHLSEIRYPQLFLQGSKDKLANIVLMEQVMSSLTHGSMVAFEGADHSFNTPKKAGISKEEMIKKLVHRSIEWINALS
jgi:hypothetical protein